ncbi:hypothetical protein GCM10022251_13370 [Phytohabitans flavus]|uniref:Uncharacterized protein n=1 Tax=Phytohabitans flavus TaxID=1076124 RepID=A0A6F8XJ65_9ACTN|nr:hypothetical protein [Phytohabitans flavus]BCB73838.1 hypothetical protein Pflav_002480 [Phytohabitans flavus]
MMMHPDLVLAQANDRQRELIAEADRERLLATAREARRRRQPRQEAPVRGQPVAMPAR